MLERALQIDMVMAFHMNWEVMKLQLALVALLSLTVYSVALVTANVAIWPVVQEHIGVQNAGKYLMVE